MGQSFVARNEMTLVDTIELKGKSATFRQHVPDLRKLIQRKKEKNDYDVLWFLTLNRFDRDRSEGEDLFRDFEKAGVLIITEKEGTFTGKYGWLKRQMYLSEAQGYVEDLALHAGTGVVRLVKEGVLPHGVHPPFGIDKMYTDAKGVPQFILRKVSKGLVHRLDPEGNKVGEYASGGENKAISWRIPGGKVTLVPGDPDKVDAVRRIYKLHHVDGWGTHRIASLLNSEGVRSMWGGTFSMGAVEAMLNNATYTGVGYANMWTAAKHCSHGKDGPVVYETPREPSASFYDPKVMNKRITKKLRPMKDWIECRYPELETFLPEPIRQKAIDAQQAYFKARDLKLETNRAGRKAGGDRHYDTSYILSGLLHTVQGDENGNPVSMVGVGKHGKYRYYNAARNHYKPTGKLLLDKHVRAEPIEKAVLDALATTIGNGDEIVAIIRQKVDEAFEIAREGRDELEGLQEDKAAKEIQYRFILDELDPNNKHVVKAKLMQLDAELKTLDQRIGSIMQSQFISEDQVEKTVKAVVKQVRTLGTAVEKKTVTGRDMRRLLGLLLQRLDLDLETMTMYVDVGIPKWSIQRPEELDPNVTVDLISSRQDRDQPEELKPLIFGSFECVNATPRSKNACFKCSRKPPQQPETKPAQKAA
jgi:recombinase